MFKKWLIVLILLVIAIAAIAGGKLYQNRRAANAAAHQSYPPTTVSTAVAEQQIWSPDISTVASLMAVSGTEITAQIAGNVTQIAFESGTPVKKGALLVRLDDSTQLAQRHADEAKLRLARTTLTRARKLFAANATSDAALQQAEADLATSQAALENDRALLNKLHIKAPFNGVLGIRQVSLGQYVSPGTPIVELQSYSPIYVNFSLPQNQLAHLANGNTVKFHTDAYGSTAFTGRITAIAPGVNPQTRNVDVQATFANLDAKLRPGLFGTATLAIGAGQAGIEVPDTAIAYSTFGDTVYVVKGKAGEGQHVKSVIVHVAQERGGKVLIDKGLATGDVVVIAGQNKLRDGAPVVVSNQVMP
ncbi:MAG: efflux RND transporter periplasmic adaptor subunit [Nevskiaceae bacterium]|nr:MAG: efflux RND transporter periplasmic adaptor subunit [Nevskiaceae bacterium]TBR74753.1 MAG: efflux RND transporter periplasmic adaptor subunit [Nevskiaceae bacterium]